MTIVTTKVKQVSIRFAKKFQHLGISNFSSKFAFNLGMKNNQHISVQMTQIIADFFNNLRKSVKSASSAYHKTVIS